MNKNKDTYLNWEVKFKNNYPYAGPIWIDTNKNTIVCYVKHLKRNACYLPCTYSIKSEIFVVAIKLFL